MSWGALENSIFNRPDLNNLFMDIAEKFARRSTCCKLKTCALLVRDGRIISMGYNGVVSGQGHCDRYWYNKYLESPYVDTQTFEEYCQSEPFLSEHHVWSEPREIHGEQNCILYAAKNGLATDNSTMYTVYSPCVNCAKVIVASGIGCVYYRHVYQDTRGIDFLSSLECPVVRI